MAISNSRHTAAALKNIDYLLAREKLRYLRFLLFNYFSSFFTEDRKGNKEKISVYSRD